jgi:hypothetical protein
MLHDGITRSQLVIIDGANDALIWTHGSVSHARRFASC